MVKIEVTADEAEYLVKLLEWRATNLADFEKPYERNRYGILDFGPERPEVKVYREKHLAKLKLIKSMLPKVKSALAKK